MPAFFAKGPEEAPSLADVGGELISPKVERAYLL
jgi:hypothetical protein